LWIARVLRRLLEAQRLLEEAINPLIVLDHSNQTPEALAGCHTINVKPLASR
jgi:hypothetical protein